MSEEAITCAMAEEKTWWLYIVETESGKLYTGITTDVDRRFHEHFDKNNSRGAKFFRSDPAKAVVYTEPYVDRADASKREYVVKKMSRLKKTQMIAGT